VTDLDGTLWGGVIGDDGVDGIELGTGSAAGEAYAAFGRYLAALRSLGVVLAVDSKNDPVLAREVFERHRESPLRAADFAAFVCNWSSKSENLREIARQLNLGLDSLVFVDDNPAECEQVRREVPEVTVVPLTGDPATFPRRLAELHLFTPLELTAEDLARPDSYRVVREIGELAGTPASMADYLAGLHMEAELGLAAEGDLPRVEQLVRKTNQFNLTGRTYDGAVVGRMLAAPGTLIATARLKDRYANHGLVSALVARVDAATLEIDNWVLSCRVFGRGLEECILEWLRGQARARGCRRIAGDLLPTARNQYARRFFARLGYEETSPGAPIRYEVMVDGEPFHTWIAVR
jgi:FkbH-like protein